MLNAEDLLISIDDAVWHMELPSKKFVYINHKLAAICEKPLNDLQTNPDIWNQLIHPDDKQWVKDKFRESLKGNKIDIEYRIITSNAIKWVNHKETLIVDTKGRQERLIGRIEEITSRKNKELEVAESEKLYRYLFQNHPNPMWIYDTKTLSFLAVNEAAIAIYGYSKEEFLSMNIQQIRSEADLNRLKSYLEKATNKKIYKNYWRHKRKNGLLLWVDIVSHSVIYQNLDARIIQAIDVTETVNAQEQLLKSKTNLAAVINNTHDLIWSIDKNYTLISANNAFKEMIFGISGNKIKEGDNVLKNYSKRQQNQWLIYYNKAMEERHTYSFIENTDNNYFEVKISPVYTEGVEITGASCFIHNITEYITSQAKILEKNSNLREIAQLAAHDIRGPVTSIMGLMNLINKTDLSDPNNIELIALLGIATKQLDSVIHKIVDKTSEVNRAEELSDK